MRSRLTTEQVQPDGSPDVPVAHQSVRNMANAMAAKARAGLRVVDLTFRRDYREDPEDPEHDQILEDTDVDRAWGTGDWARRAGSRRVLGLGDHQPANARGHERDAG
jgi:hypothetical protein